MIKPMSFVPSKNLNKLPLKIKQNKEKSCKPSWYCKDGNTVMTLAGNII